MRTVDNQVLTALHQIRDAIKNKECCCNKDEQGGGGLTGNILDDWVNAVTQGEYTKYEDVPVVNNVGFIEGWAKSNGKFVPEPDPNGSVSALKNNIIALDSNWIKAVI